MSVEVVLYVGSRNRLRLYCTPPVRLWYGTLNVDDSSNKVSSFNVGQKVERRYRRGAPCHAP
jgi:hypothetical protein